MLWADSSISISISHIHGNLDQEVKWPALTENHTPKCFTPVSDVTAGPFYQLLKAEYLHWDK